MKSNQQMYELCAQRRWEEIERSVERGEWKADACVTDPSLGTRFSLLVCAAQDGASKLAKALIQRGASPNTRQGGQSVLMIASAAGHNSIVDLLLEAGADVHTKWRGETALMEAAEQNHKDVARRLLKAGARVSDRDRKGRSALSLAATRGRVDAEMISLLVEAGSPVDGRDLHVPVALRECDIVKLLLSKRPDVNARFDWPSFAGAPITKGDTPLHVAAGDTIAEGIMKAGLSLENLKPAERLAIVEQLLAAGADVNAQRLKTGWTPLLLATDCDEAEIADKLIRAGAGPRQEFDCRVTPFPLSKPRTLVSRTLSAITLAGMRPRNRRIRKLLLGEPG